MEQRDRERFDGLLAELFGALDLPLSESKREAFWKGLRDLSVTEFSRICDRVLEDQKRGEPARRFGLGDVWAIRRSLRASTPEPIHEQAWAGDAWDIAANQHLFAYIGARLKADPSAYGPVRPFSFKPKEPCYSPEQKAATDILVSYKNAWAQDMREAQDPHGHVPSDVQRESWRDCMQRAEARIAQKAAA